MALKINLRPSDQDIARLKEKGKALMSLPKNEKEVMISKAVGGRMSDMDKKRMDSIKDKAKLL